MNEFQPDYANCKYSIFLIWRKKGPEVPFQCALAALHPWSSQSTVSPHYIYIVCLCVQPCNMKQILIGAYSAVLPCESWMLVEALCLRSSWMRRWFPLADALCSGVESNLSVALGSAPFSSSIRAI